MTDDRLYMRISELLLLCYDGSATAEQIAELESLLDRNRRALEYCVDISKELNYFHCLGQVPLSHPEAVETLDTEFMSELGPQQQMALLGDFAEYEKHAETMDMPRTGEAETAPPVRKRDTARPVRSINKFSLGLAAASLAAVCLMILYVRLAPPAPYEVATVRDAIDAEWSAGLPVSPGTRISSNSKPIRLTQGIVKLRTDDQVDIVLEAPSEFYFSSYSEVSMQYGKLFAHVTDRGYGFSVVTPNSKVVDLGTEFGVLSHIDGNTEVHLYKGKANVFAGQKHQRKTSELLEAGAARRVQAADADVQPIDLNEQALVRSIDSDSAFVWRGQKYLRLTDLLLGGDGFGTSTLTNIEFDPATGAAVTVGEAGYRTGPGSRLPIGQSPYLDGIFVPGRQTDGMVITSGGHRFAQCPPTSGTYYSNIICGKNCAFFGDVQALFDARRRFEDFGFLYLHSNIGLTVDLEAVRRAAPGLRLTAFEAFAGIVDLWNNAPDYSEADVWVLVDGQVRASRKALRADQGFEIRVELAETDRFLSLAVTDGGQVKLAGNPANHYDTCGFAEPMFELVLP